MPRSRRLQYGEGSVYEDTDGRWRGELRLDGQRKRVSGRTKAEVTDKLANVRKELLAGKPLAGDDTTLGQWVQWFDKTVLDGKNPLTADNYRWSLRQAKPLYGKKLRALTVEDVEGLLMDLSQRKASRPSTKPKGRGSDRGAVRGPLGQTSLKRVRAALVACLTEAERRDLVSKNVARLSYLPPKATPPRVRRSLTPNQAKKAWKVLADDPDGPMVLTQLTTGLRPGELLALEWSALDLKSGTLTVRQALNRVPGGGVKVGPPKTASSVRTLRIPEGLVEVLKAHRAAQREVRMAAPVWHDDLDLVFPTGVGTLRNHKDLAEVVARVGDQVGVEKLTPHELRHSAASLLVEDGAGLTAVADLLGHVDVTMLAKVYRHKVTPVVDLTEHQSRLAGGADG